MLWVIRFFAGVLLVFALTQSAFSAGYKSDDEIKTGGVPHGGFATGSDKCRSCHGVHQAGGLFRLLRADELSTACQYCHGETGIVDFKRVWLDEAGHGTTQTAGFLQAPDDITVTTFPIIKWGCLRCHSVHNSETIILAGELDSSATPYSRSKLLRKRPNPFKTYPLTTYNPDATSETISQWCSNCHGANYGLHTTTKTVGGESRWGHDVSPGGYKDTTAPFGLADIYPGDGLNNGPKCSQCHTASGAPAEIAQKFPHSGGAVESMLKAGTIKTQLDNFCTGSPCHYVPSLP